MNKVIRITLLCALAFSASSASFAQKRATNKASRKVAAPQILCEGDAIPKGHVVVGHKMSAKCGDKPQLITRKPDGAEIVCSGSPIPDGYRVANELSSTDCMARGTSNALSIVSNDLVGYESSTPSLVGDGGIGSAFASGKSNVQVEGEGKVISILPDDLNGKRHQRFIVRLASGLMLLITHNIDIAPRIDSLEPGDNVRFNGEYVWNEQGGLIHWTHDDPQRKHVSGWIRHKGKMYR